VADHPPVSALSAGLALRCPRCGQGRLFKSYLKVADACEVCGLDLSAEDSGDGPAVFVIFVVGFIAALLVVVMEFVIRAPMLVSILAVCVVVVGGTMALLPPFKAVLIALQYRHRAGDTGMNTFRDDSEA